MDAVGVAVEDRLTPVLFVRSDEQAARYCALLERVDIPALIGQHTDFALKGFGVPILVPESLHERSSEILAAKEATFADHDYDDDPEEDDEDDDFFPDDPDDEDEEDDEFLDDGFD